jgi:hypothetical protein
MKTKQMTIKPEHACFFLLIFLTTLHAHSQTITRDDNPGITGTVCPILNTHYTVTTPTGLTNCTKTWTAVNGDIVSANGLPNVTVSWKDMPGATASLKCAFSGCTGATEVAFTDQLILSVNGQNFDAYGNSVTIDYCTTNSVTINVPHMWVQGTGGVAQPPLQEVIYSWTLPAGWTTNGGLNTTVNSITIYPTHCAVSGTGMVSVKGNIIDRCGSAGLSNAATISLNGARPVVSLVIPQGYTGSTACNTTPVTFTANLSPSLSCASTYSWTKPSSWTLVSQSGNQVTLQPSGRPDDATTGSISVAVTFTCGTVITSGNYTPPYTPPYITGPDPVCSSGTYSIQGAPNTVSWTSSNTSALTIDANGVGTRQGNASTTISASFAGGCTAPISPKTVWVGNPVISDITVNTSMCPGYSQIVAATVFGNPTSLNWVISSGNAGNAYLTDYGDGRAYFNSYVIDCYGLTLTMTNSCGPSQGGTTICVDYCPSSTYNVYPNPASSTLTIQVTDSTESKSLDHPYQLNIMDRFSRKVFSTQSNKKVLEIPVNNLPPDIYYLNLFYKDAVLQKQIEIKR